MSIFHKLPILCATTLLAATSISASDSSGASCCSPSSAMTSPAETMATPSENEINALSEAFGHLIGRNMENPLIAFDVDKVVLGIRNQAAGIEAPVSAERFQAIITQIEQEAFEKAATENLAAAETFLENNKSKNSVVEAVPGKLQYEVLAEGDGPLVAPHSAPSILYKGVCLDGTVVGNTAKVDEPIQVALDQTVSGFKQGVEGMRLGEKRKLYIHPELAYGTSGTLPPNSLLMFEVEIVKTTDPLEPSGDLPVTASASPTSSEEPVR